MTKLLAEKTALITGASSGIGQGIAAVLAREGANVAFTYRGNRTGAENTAEQLHQYGVKTMMARMDIAELSHIESLIERVLSEFGALDILVNNAGITNKYNFIDVTPEEYDELFKINCRGTFFTAQRAARYMKEHGGGSIINISSLSSRASTEGFSVYAATKAAMNKFTETAAIELAPYHIRVNAVAAGWVPVGEELRNQTPENLRQAQYHIPVGRFGTPKDIGEICAFLASDRAEFITGQTIFSDGGQSSILSLPSKQREKRVWGDSSQSRDRPM